MENNEMTVIKTYKGIPLKYNERNGRIYFEFEGMERETSYIFEAEQIIDEPRWEECELYGYFIDGYIDKYIGTAKATRRDIKSGQPDWLIKGQYDTNLKSSRDTQIYLKSPSNDRVYAEWKAQRDIYNDELRKLNQIVGKLQN